MANKNAKTELSKQQLPVELLKVINGWIDSADNKANTILAFNGAIFAFLVTQSTDIKSFVSKLDCGGLIYDFITLLYLSYLTTFFYSIYHVLKTLLPDIKTRHPSLFFFGSISNETFENYRKKYFALKNDDAVDVLLEQVHTNSTIANLKHKNLQKAIKSLFVNLVIFVVILLVRALNGI